jgi:hypothetical protein
LNAIRGASIGDFVVRPRHALAVQSVFFLTAFISLQKESLGIAKQGVRRESTL